MKKFAVFDIDGTILRWQFFHAIVNQLAKQQLITGPENQRIKQARMAWKNRTTSDAFHDYEDVLVQTYLKVLPRITNAQHHQAEDAVYGEYQNQLFTFTRDLIKTLKQQNYLIFSISGSHHYIVGKFAKGLGIDDFIAAKAEFKNGKYTGRINTPITDKATALNNLVQKHNASFINSYAVGDSASDAAMFKLVDNPIAFNPDQKLYKMATANKWPIVIERKNVIYQLSYQKGNYVLGGQS